MPVNSRYQLISVDLASNAVIIRWGDDHISRFPNIWLYEACQCDVCGSSESAVRHVSLRGKPEQPIVSSCRNESGKLHIDWENEHGSTYDLIWLRSQCLSESERTRRKFRPLTWGQEMSGNLPYLSYSEIVDSAELHRQFLESILETGFVILKDVPPGRERTEEIAALVGKLRMTNYEIYELESKPDPEISGDMAVPLNLHTDEPYRIEPPAITFFHVLKQADIGGASTLVDSYHIVEQLRLQYPDSFETLCRIPARYHRSLIEGRLFEYQRPIIQRDGDGDISGVYLLDRGMAPVDCALEDVEPFYRALRQLLNLVDAGEGSIEFRVETGEMLVFNNQRLMHGRTSFDPASGRHVRTCHVDLDEFYSRLRVCYRDLDDPRRWMTFRKN